MGTISLFIVRQIARLIILFIRVIIYNELNMNILISNYSLCWMAYRIGIYLIGYKSKYHIDMWLSIQQDNITTVVWYGLTALAVTI